ncbi:hypothetical protein P43SY_002002 [Pythium insidiosum]|uniref:Glutathione transferase, theta class n=1 Tax=Pythium insidiosum TaxID=114742 RepID=A0AAD5LKT0_PYTIN|nr:hypothetical protein P43SY_002002 [Pythium insidiosum]
MAQLPLHDEVHTVMNGFMKATGLENVGKTEPTPAPSQHRRITLPFAIDMTLKLYGHLISQPTRAVAWLLRVKGVSYELVPTMPKNGDTRTPEYLRMNPNALVPTIKDGDFTLFEGNAILAYLAEKHHWTDVYPTDLHTRAKIHQYLHWHHTNVRLGTPQVLLPYIMKVNGAATPEHLEKIATKEQTIGRFVGILEQLFKAPYIAENHAPTLADYACYCELDQLEAMEVFDFGKYAKTSDWMKRMKEIPHHDEVREPLFTFLEKMKLKPVQQ